MEFFNSCRGPRAYGVLQLLKGAKGVWSSSYPVGGQERMEFSSYRGPRVYAIFHIL